MATILEIDATTNIATERSETAAEKLARENLHETHLAEIQTAKNKVKARQAVLDKLGLTQDEAEALLG